jgi:acetolactate synthase-1/2/3 large subunit
MARSVTKSSWTCTNAENIQDDIKRAYEIANTGRPGPVHIALPVDILEEKLISNKSPIKNQTSNGNLKSITKSEFEKIMDALQSAKRPLILAGQAISRKGKKILLDLSLSSKIPIVNMESPRGVNDPSLGSFSEVLKEADLIFLLGKKIDFGLKFGDDSTLSSNANIVQIDYDKSVLEQGKKAIYPPERIIVSSEVDPLLVIKKIVEVKEISVNNVWVNQVQSALKYNPPEWAIQKKSSEDGPIHPLTVCSIVQNMLNKQKDSVFISDGGEFGQWTQACISAPNRIINGPAGAIGASIPTAIAASIAHPEKTIIAMLGDGTFGFHGMEFDTAVRYNLPFIAIIGNDARWNAEYQIQLNNYGSDRTIGCELHPSRYDLVVKALGGHGENVTTASELAPALDRALNSGLPACINVSIQPIKAPIIKKT